MLFRSGAIIPMCEDLMNIHHDTIGKLKLLIEPSQDSSFVLYEDDGMTNEYKNGEYLKTIISVKKDSGVKIIFEKEGHYLPHVKEMTIDLICKDVAPVQVSVKERKLPMFLDKKEWEASVEGWYYDIEQKTAKIKYSNINESYDININFDVKDLITI